MRNYPRPLSTYLGHVSLESMAVEIAEHQQWRETVKKLLPASLGQHCDHAMLRKSALVVIVGSAAGATLLRFQAPSLLSRIQSEIDPSVTEIKVRIGRPLANPTKSPHQRVIRAAVVQHLEEYGESCEHQEIRAAVSRLSQTLRRG